jgi:hypothetical protein
VNVPGAESYEITFDDQSRTEQNYDFVRFVGLTNDTIYGQEKYTGGRGGSSRNFPGIDGAAPL